MKPLKIIPANWPLIILISLILPTIALSQRTNFGQRGRDGRHGINGIDGSNGQNVTIIANGNPANYEINGQNGTPGKEGEAGESATDCNPPFRPAFSLEGVNGGDAGNGGNGGNGGSGGDVIIYYTDIANLKQIKINNSFGQGSQGGQGGQGGRGCVCQESQWTINYCQWELWKRPQKPPQNITNPNPENPWVFDSEYQTQCTGIAAVDQHQNAPSLPSDYRNQRNFSFQWIYQGINRTKNFSCQSGDNGRNGNNGKNGQNGSYGKVSLVPRGDIPRENTSYTNSIANLVNQPVELVKNIWLTKNGLANLLAIGSNVPDTFQYLDNTIRTFFVVKLASDQTLEELGISRTQITAFIDIQNHHPTVKFRVPDTIEYKTSQDIPQRTTILSITGGFAPERVKAFDIKVSGTSKNHQLILEDRGKVRPLLKNMNLEIIAKTKESASGLTVSQDYQERLRYQYEIPPTGLLSRDLTENDHIYTIPTGKNFYPWLKSGYHVEYEIIITQITRTGTVYTQQKKINFIAD